MGQLHFKRTQYVNSTPLPPPHLGDSINYSKILLKHNGDTRKVRCAIRGAVMMCTVGESWRGTSSGEKWTEGGGAVSASDESQTSSQYLVSCPS